MFDLQGNRKYLNSTERDAFRKSASVLNELAEKTFCLTLLHTGCRISEALNVTCSRVDVSEKALIFETLKRRKQRIFRAVPIPDSLVRALQRLTKGKKPSDRIWTISRTTAWRVVKQRMSHAGITGTKACPKGLRHGFAICALTVKIPLTTVKKWLGHARLETTEIYTEALGDEERALARRMWS